MTNLHSFVTAADNWETIYYPNPIPLSSRCFLSMALLFDRVHVPGVSLPLVPDADDERRELLTWSHSNPEFLAYRNLTLWAIEYPLVADFIYLPDAGPQLPDLPSLEAPALQLLDDTYGSGTSGKVLALNAIHGIMPDRAEGHGFALTWPLYQARALQYAAQTRLQFVSDDPLCVPPLPPHPELGSDRTKHLAQQLAVEAIKIVLPQFRSVELGQVAEFRSQVQPLIRPFRTEMVKLTADLTAAITVGSTDDELRGLCRALVESRIAPALTDLARQLRDPATPFRKVMIDFSEAAVAAASSTLSPALTVGWALLRGAKIASEYVSAYQDKEGKRKSGLGYLLAIDREFGNAQGSVSAWDTVDWRCSGFVEIPDPGFPLTPLNQEIVSGPMNNFTAETVRQLFQTKTMSAVKFVPPRDR